MGLTDKRCVPCEGGIAPLSQRKAEALLKELDGAWRIADNKIERPFRFKNFRQAVAFVNEVAEVAEGEGHHPDIHLENWNRVRIVLHTHAINGLHENDFIVAAKIDALVE